MQNSGLVGRAQNAVVDYAAKQKQEEQDMNDLDKRLQELIKGIGSGGGSTGGSTGESVGGTKGDYTKVGTTYCNTPDLSGFNASCTYYITYDGNDEKIAGRVDVIDPPTNWYDYGSKKWANVVTVNENDVTYWVWIPRYKYKINAKENLEVAFVSTANECKKEDGTPVELTAEYKLPDSFTFGGENLAGFWISKYEVQLAKEDGEEMITTVVEDNVKKITTTKPSGTYTIYVNGKFLGNNISLPYSIEELEKLPSYDIMLVSNTSGKIVGSRKKVGTRNPNIEIDLSGFNPDCTWYVTYDDLGNETRGNKIVLDDSGKATNMPDNWYSYENKRWANIVTENNGLTTYWTYIPRYEYKIWSNSQYVEVKFIRASQKEADAGYTLPDSFTFGGQDLAGFWISKYEVQEAQETVPQG